MAQEVPENICTLCGDEMDRTCEHLTKTVCSNSRCIPRFYHADCLEHHRCSFNKRMATRSVKIGYPCPRGCGKKEAIKPCPFKVVSSSFLLPTGKKGKAAQLLAQQQAQAAIAEEEEHDDDEDSEDSDASSERASSSSGKGEEEHKEEAPKQQPANPGVIRVLRATPLAPPPVIKAEPLPRKQQEPLPSAWGGKGGSKDSKPAAPITTKRGGQVLQLNYRSYWDERAAAEAAEEAAAAEADAAASSAAASKKAPPPPPPSLFPALPVTHAPPPPAPAATSPAPARPRHAATRSRPSPTPSRRRHHQSPSQQQQHP